MRTIHPRHAKEERIGTTERHEESPLLTTQRPGSSEIVSQHVLGSNHRKLTSSDSATAVTEEMSSVTGGAPAQLLMRTGLAKLLESCLKVSLSFTNDEKWGAFLLNSSIWSLRGLILKVTKKPLPHPSSKGKEGEGGGGLFHDGIQTDQSSRKKVRGNQGLDGVEGWWRKGKDERELSDSLTNLINQSIFSNWSFLTLSTSPSNQRVAIATCQVLPTLLKDLGIQSSRLISIILDWSCGWLSTLRFDSVFTFRKISLALKSCQMVLQVIQSLFKHSCLERQEEEDTVEDRGPPNSSSLPLSKRVAPGLETWSKKVLTSSLRLWTRFNDQVINEGSLKKKTRNEKVLGRPSSPLLERDLEALRKDLEKSLRSTFSLLFRLVPSSRKLATRIVELDPILFKPVIESF
ncbi:hypothetical protein IE53DRAFT_203403 [Violaceomyces palustris]|uniref:Uncharacterized protein n=1 Tax=Violaceomyces palustris TaxID=1673888 RepID=A0ACD0P4Y6_9BASI|nr:hypothetical protein IE53DRAFT_203403 [Violaceomyces palustris]